MNDDKTVGKQDDGGPAFPLVVRQRAGENTSWEYGMSLRDYFAIHAPADEVKALGAHQNISSCAARYLWAADMLKARSPS